MHSSRASLTYTLQYSPNSRYCTLHWRRGVCMCIHHLMGVASIGLTLLWSTLHQSAPPTITLFNISHMTIKVTQATG